LNRRVIEIRIVRKRAARLESQRLKRATGAKQVPRNHFRRLGETRQQHGDELLRLDETREISRAHALDVDGQRHQVGAREHSIDKTRFLSLCHPQFPCETKRAQNENLSI
jgi:hypothetical protein